MSSLENKITRPTIFLFYLSSWSDRSLERVYYTDLSITFTSDCLLFFFLRNLYVAPSKLKNFLTRHTIVEKIGKKEGRGRGYRRRRIQFKLNDPIALFFGSKVKVISRVARRVQPFMAGQGDSWQGKESLFGEACSGPERMKFHGRFRRTRAERRVVRRIGRCHESGRDTGKVDRGWFQEI